MNNFLNYSCLSTIYFCIKVKFVCLVWDCWSQEPTKFDNVDSNGKLAFVLRFSALQAVYEKRIKLLNCKIALKVKYEPLSTHDLQTRVQRKRKLTPTYFFFKSVLDECEWLISRYSRFIPGEKILRYPFPRSVRGSWRGSWWVNPCFCQEINLRKNSLLEKEKTQR